ncbi:Sodium channel protein type 11 subunit alpha [Porphyridium purpureum]|uniref:Sodium channel protein type 11 subunit alpha n=1 Tax=Porphyridium purpureum TaxID=35688 RepID=A0A5J4YI43_PORPP|nr:Sodium channel protein type 11 subunit alpha [Porphyridium purpureum]|eukprot:POR6063..scf297_16
MDQDARAEVQEWNKEVSAAATLRALRNVPLSPTRPPTGRAGQESEWPMPAGAPEARRSAAAAGTATAPRAADENVLHEFASPRHLHEEVWYDGLGLVVRPDLARMNDEERWKFVSRFEDFAADARWEWEDHFDIRQEETDDYTMNDRSLFLFGPRNSFRFYCHKISKHTYWYTFCLLHSILAFTMTTLNSPSRQQYTQAYKGVLYYCLAFFTVDVLMKVIAQGLYVRAPSAKARRIYGKPFLWHNWNILDLVTVVLGFASITRNLSPLSIRILYVIHACEYFNVFPAAYGFMRVLLNTFLDLAGSVLQVLVIVLVLGVFMFSSLRGSMHNFCNNGRFVFVNPRLLERVMCGGVECPTLPNAQCTWRFNESSPLFPSPGFGQFNFDNLFFGSLATYVISTGQDWSTYARLQMDGGSSWLAILYVTIVLLGTGLIENGILVQVMNSYALDQRKALAKAQMTSRNGYFLVNADKRKSEQFADIEGKWDLLLALYSAVAEALHKRIGSLTDAIYYFVFVPPRIYVYDLLMASVVLLNTVALCLTTASADANRLHILDTINTVCGALFIADTSLQIIGRGLLAVLSSAFGWLDLIVVITTILSWTLEGSFVALSALRVLRILAIFKYFEAGSIHDFWRSAAKTCNILPFTMAFVCILASIGMSAFGPTEKSLSGDLCLPESPLGSLCSPLPWTRYWVSMLNVFILFSQYGWSESMYRAMNQTLWISFTYFVAAMFLLTSLVLGFMVAIVFTEYARLQGERDINAQRRESNDTTGLSDTVAIPFARWIRRSEHFQSFVTRLKEFTGMDRDRGAADVDVMFYEKNKVDSCATANESPPPAPLDREKLDGERKQDSHLQQVLGWGRVRLWHPYTSALVIASGSIAAAFFHDGMSDSEWYNLRLTQVIVLGLWTVDTALFVALCIASDVLPSNTSKAGSIAFATCVWLIFLIDVIFLFARPLTNITALIALRSVRPLRALQICSRLRRPSYALLRALPEFLGVWALWAVVTLVFAIMGVSFFGGQFSYCSCGQSLFESLDPALGNSSDAAAQRAFSAAEFFEPVLQVETLTRQAQDLECNVSSLVGLSNASTECEAMGGEWLTFRSNFDTVPNAFLTLCGITTLDAWVQIMLVGMAATGQGKQPSKNQNAEAAFFFVIYVLFSLFVWSISLAILVCSCGRIMDITAVHSDSTFLTAGQRRRRLERQIYFGLNLRAAPAKPYFRTLATSGAEFSSSFLNVSTPPLAAFERFRLKMYAISTKRRFALLVKFAVVVALVEIAVMIFPMTEPIRYARIGLLSLVVLVLGGEVIVKLFSFGIRGYFSQASNWLDLCLVILTALSLAFLCEPFMYDDLNLSSSGAGSDSWSFEPFLFVAGLFRSLYVLRLVRGVRRLPLYTKSLYFSLPGFQNVCIFIALETFSLALLGMGLFSAVSPSQVRGVIGAGITNVSNFSTLGNAWFTVLQIATGDSWTLIMYDIMSVPGYIAAWVYFLLAILVLYVLSWNLFLLVCLEGYSFTIGKDDTQLHDTDYVNFGLTWMTFDPLAELEISVWSDFEKLVRSLQPPLGLQPQTASDLFEFLQDFEPEAGKSGTITYLQSVSGLIHCMHERHRRDDELGLHRASAADAHSEDSSKEGEYALTFTERVDRTDRPVNPMPVRWPFVVKHLAAVRIQCAVKQYMRLRGQSVHVPVPVNVGRESGDSGSQGSFRSFRSGKVLSSVGCATGQTVAYLATCCRRVVGADKSQSDLSIARQRHPALQFESVDATSAESLTRLRDMVLRHGAPRAGSDDKCDAAIDVVFLDLGGIRPLEDYMPLMHLVDNTLQPRRALVIKSLYLARNAKLRDELCTDSPLSSGTNPTVKSIRRRVVQEAALRQLLSLNAQFELASIADAESDRSAATRFEKFRAGAGRECHGALLMALFAVRTSTVSESKLAHLCFRSLQRL